MPTWINHKGEFMEYSMNDQIQNITTEAPKEPLSILVFDKDGNPVEVKAISPTQVQDIEYSDTPEGN